MRKKELSRSWQDWKDGKEKDTVAIYCTTEKVESLTSLRKK